MAWEKNDPSLGNDPSYLEPRIKQNEIDIKYLQSIENVSSINGETGDVILSIPSKTSELTNDNEFITIDSVTPLSEVVTLHLDETSGKHIQSSGSNANGHWIKFDDGTLICTRDVSHDFNTKEEKYYATPSAFVSVLGGGANYGPTIVDERRDAFANTSISLATNMWRVSARTTFAGSDLIYLFAIGRWKL